MNPKTRKSVINVALVVEQLCPLVIHKILDNSICLELRSGSCSDGGAK